MQRGMSHRQQDRTKLYFASSCPWTNKYKSQFQLAKRKRCERGQFSVHRAHSERRVLKCLNTKFDSCSYTIQNPVKIPWRVSSEKTGGDVVKKKSVVHRACERSGAWSERGAERAKYSRSAERVFIQRLERSLCLAPVPLRYRSHHEPRACTNPPWIHLCLQQLTKPSAYTLKIVRCEGVF